MNFVDNLSFKLNWHFKINANFEEGRYLVTMFPYVWMELDNIEAIINDNDNIDLNGFKKVIETIVMMI